MRFCDVSHFSVGMLEVVLHLSLAGSLTSGGSAGLAHSREDQWSQNRDESVKVITHLMDII